MIAGHRRFRYHLLLVVGIASLIRFGILALLWSSWDWRQGIISDQWNELAINLVDHGVFAFFSAPDNPTIMRGPVFPFMEVPLYLLFGTNYAPWAIALLILDTITCMLLVLAVRSLWGDRPALLAGLFYSVNLPIIYYTAKISQVTSIMPFIVIWFYLLCLWERAYFSRWLLWLLGLVSGLMILNKTVYLPVPFVCAAVLLWIKRAEIRKIGHLIPLAIYLVTSVAVVAPWTYRNYVVTNGTIVPVQNMFWELVVQDVLYHDLDAAGGRNRPEGELLQYFMEKEAAITTADGLSPTPPAGHRAAWESQREKAFAKTAIKWIKEDPVKIVKIKAANLWHYWARAENWRKTQIFIVMQTVYLGAAIIGLVLLFRYRQLARVKFALILIMILWAEHSPVLGWGRFSLDLVPMLGAIFALGLDTWARHTSFRPDTAEGRIA